MNKSHNRFNLIEANIKNSILVKSLHSAAARPFENLSIKDICKKIEGGSHE